LVVLLIHGNIKRKLYKVRHEKKRFKKNSFVTGVGNGDLDENQLKRLDGKKLGEGTSAKQKRE